MGKLNFLEYLISRFYPSHEIREKFGASENNMVCST